MNTTIAELVVLLELDSNAFSRGLQAARDQLDEFGRSVAQMAQKLDSLPMLDEPKYDPRVMRWNGRTP